MHARGDGSFGRSAGTQTLKGAALLLIAIIIGVVLLHTAPANTTTISSGTSTPPTTHAPKPTKPRETTTTAGATATTAPPVRPPSQVRVAVANGSGVTGLAARIRAQLNSAGYNTATPPLNASAQVPTTSVYYVPGYQADAAVVATQQLSLPATTVKPMPTPTPLAASQLFGVDVLVLAGADIGSTTNTTEAPAGNTIAPSPRAASPPATTAQHTTTTAHPATTAARPPTTASHPTTTATHA